MVGGGIQIGITFIQNAAKDNRFKWKFLVSKGIYEGLSSEIKNLDCIICIPISPARVLKGVQSRKTIHKICNDWQPNLIYSIGFPSYVCFKQPEIGRYTNPWEINEAPLPWHIYPNFIERIKIKLGIFYRQQWAKKAAFIETQTEAAKIGIIKRLGISGCKIKVVPNSPNMVFVEAGNLDKNGLINSVPTNIFCLAAPYPHKNLNIIPEVAYHLKKDFHVEPCFILTIPEDDPLWLKIVKKSFELEVNSQLINAGKLNLHDCLNYYRNAQIVFLPTLMEVFSATYLEAMAMRVPIVTTDLPFAKDNCGDAALFFQSDCPKDAALQINELISNVELRNQIVEKGFSKLNSYPNNQEKYEELFNWFEEIIVNK